MQDCQLTAILSIYAGCIVRLVQGLCCFAQTQVTGDTIPLPEQYKHEHMFTADCVIRLSVILGAVRSQGIHSDNTICQELYHTVATPSLFIPTVLKQQAVELHFLHSLCLHFPLMLTCTVLSYNTHSNPVCDLHSTSIPCTTRHSCHYA